MSALANDVRFEAMLDTFGVHGSEDGDGWHKNGANRRFLLTLLWNIQHPTSNTQHPLNCQSSIHWMFDVGCWMLDVFHYFTSCLSPHTTSPHYATGGYRELNCEHPHQGRASGPSRGLWNALP